MNQNYHLVISLDKPQLEIDKLTIQAFFLTFLTYSFIGWLYESTLWAICEKKMFINRGFLLEPYCPIYGVVSLMDWFLLCDIQNPIKIFFTALLVCSFFEYFTSWAMEKLFQARWWDYSNYPFNLNGRISLYSSLLFGLLGLLLVKIVHPFFFSLYSSINPKISLLICLLLGASLIADITITVISMLNFNKKVKTIHEEISSHLNSPFDYLNEHKEYMEKNLIVQKSKGILLKMENLNEQIKRSELRIINAFPNFKSTKYDSIVQKIKSVYKTKNKKEKEEPSN